MSESDKSSDAQTTEQVYREKIANLEAQVRLLQEELSRRSLHPEDSERQDLRSARADRREGDDLDEEDDDRADEDDEDSTSDVVRDIPVRTTDELSKIARSVTLASIEQLRLAARVVDTFANEVFNRNQPKPRRRSRHRSDERDFESSESEPKRGRRSKRSSVTELTGNLAQDISAGVARALDQSFEIPKKIVDKLSQSYRESEEEEETPTEREATRIRRRAEDAKREAEEKERDAVRARRRAARLDREAAQASREASTFRDMRDTGETER
jgi:hypothetical protein